MIFKKISKRSLLIQELLCMFLWIVLSFFPYIYLDRYSVLWTTVLVGLFVSFIFLSCIYFPINYRNTKYCIGENKIYFQTGVFVKRQSIMSRNSIVSVMLVFNPWSPMLGIASVVVKAAGATIHIPYLTIDQAKMITEELAPLHEF